MRGTAPADRRPMSSTARRPHDYRQRRFRPEAHENSGASHPLTTRYADSSYPRRAQRRRWNLARVWTPAGPHCREQWKSQSRRKEEDVAKAEREEEGGDDGGEGTKGEARRKIIREDRKSWKKTKKRKRKKE